MSDTPKALTLTASSAETRRLVLIAIRETVKACEKQEGFDAGQSGWSVDATRLADDVLSEWRGP